MNPARIRTLTEDHPLAPGVIAYWMSRDIRVHDNWALLKASDMATAEKRSVIVIFNLVESFLGAGERQFDFLLMSLEEVEKSLRSLNIPFYLLTGNPAQTIPKAIQEYQIGGLVTDFSPLRISREWKQEVCQRISIPVYEVDAHNIVPPWVVSDKQEYAARTIRPKIKALLPTWLVEIPAVHIHNQSIPLPSPIDWKQVRDNLVVDTSVPPVTWIKPGEDASLVALHEFIQYRLNNYDSDRNKPEINGLSNLSPYLHFGNLSAHRVALAVAKSGKNQDSIDGFLEELIIRRELSENFCWYNPHYDSFDGFPTWAKNTLNDHRNDYRDHLYSLYELEHSLTHDPLWNAAQNEMVAMGKMHGYMRMYWAKKILEWTASPEQALKFTIYLNDRYELDGRDPIGYTSIAWSIGGVHDHGWTERPIFGKIRFMSLASTGRKFDSKAYIAKWSTSKESPPLF